MKKISILEYIKMKLVPEKMKEDEPEVYETLSQDLNLSPELPHKKEDLDKEKKLIQDKAKKNWERFQRKHQQPKQTEEKVRTIHQKILLKAAILLLVLGLIIFAYQINVDFQEKDSLSYDSVSTNRGFLFAYSIPISLTALGMILLLYHASRNPS